MVYELIEEGVIKDKPFRKYRNGQGSESTTEVVYKDADGNRWWGFKNLMQIPIIRKSMASYITSLYNVGLSLNDIKKWCADEKTLLKGNDPEKYEKLYAMVLEKEKIAIYTADPVKAALALATIYIMSEKERIDYFDPEESEKKLRLWLGMPEAVGFFLTWQNKHIESYMKRLDKASRTASTLERLTNQGQ